MARAHASHRLIGPAWRKGMTNLMRKENGEWWHTGRWWTQSLIWLLVINGPLAFGLWVMPIIEPDLTLEVALAQEFLVQMMAWFPMFGVIVITQEAIINEKQAGTAAWVLSAPVSREAFILSKLLANALGFFVTVIVLQGTVGYGQLSLYGGTLLSIGSFLAPMGLFSLYLLFYLTLTLMLGTFFNTRGPVMGITIAVAIASMREIGQLLSGFAPWLAKILPEAMPVLARTIATNVSLPAYWPVSMVVLLLYSLLFVAVAIWRFRREEF